MKKIITFLICCLAFAANAQVRSITGIVSSENDASPVVGAMVTVKGSTAYSMTDGAGRYSIEASQNDVLVFSLLGYVSGEAVVGTSTTIDIKLRPDATTIEDLVVIGYGVQQKKLITGATVQVKGEDIAKLNTVSALGAMQSQTPGVNITQLGGMPNQGYKVQVRGMGTIGDSDPLYVIDGIPAGNSDNGRALNMVNPSDIESIDVLKDAASAAIYGSRAANGVILITTKQGRKSSKAQVSFDAYYGVQNVYKIQQMLNAQQYAVIMNEARLMDGLPAYDFEKLLPAGLWKKIEDGSWKGTNWLDESRNRNAPMQNYSLNVTGGSDQSIYSFGLSYTSQEGIMGHPAPPAYNRYTARLNTEFTLVKGRSFDIVKLGENLTYVYTHTPAGMSMGDQWSNDIRTLMVASPFMPVYNEKGEYHYAIDWEPRQVNPIGRHALSRKDTSINRDHSLRSSIYLTVQPLRDLIFKSTFGYALGAYSGRSFSPLYNLGTSPGDFNNTERVSQSIGLGQDITFENTLTYKFDIADRHHFTALAGQSIEMGGGPMGENMSAGNANPSFSDLEHAYINNAPLIVTGQTTVSGAPYGMYRLASFFGRVSYDFDNRYMLTAVLRGDGSSNFARGRRWGIFPSVSAGWVVSEESFMEGLRGKVDFLKLRASWGQNGNQSINPFQYLSPITTSGRYTFGGDKQKPSIAAFPTILANPDISWETSEQIDLGFDATLLRNRLNVTMDYYVKNTKDWLVAAPQLGSYGAGASTGGFPGNPYINGGDIRNSGFEMAFDWKDTAGELQYGANVNFAFNKNRVTRIANEEGIIRGPDSFMYQNHQHSFRAQTGFPIGYFYGYNTAGIFQTQDEIDNYKGAKLPDTRPGDVIWVDRDNNGKIDENDRGMIGNPHPDMTMGLGLNLSWRGFDLGVTARGAFGGQIMRSWRSWLDSPRDNHTIEILGRWHGVGTSNRLPRLTSASHTNAQYVSDLYVENGDYLRIQNVTLGYDFTRLIKTGFLSQLRLYVTGQNLFTFTGYSGMDPEVGGGGSYNWASGIDMGFYPSPRTVIVGVNVKF